MTRMITMKLGNYHTLGCPNNTNEETEEKLHYVDFQTHG